MEQSMKARRIGVQDRVAALSWHSYAALSWHSYAACLTAVLAFCMAIFFVGKEGYSNNYYTAAVQSMLTSFHNFFFVSFDSAGFISVDKPPLGLWLQAGSAKLFGLNAYALMLPGALALGGTVLLVYHMVSRAWGRPGGLFAALATALTPVLIAVSRTNNLDTVLLFFMTAALACALRSAREHKFSWMLGAMILLGLGFNVKMLQAYLVLPAVFLVFWLGNKGGVKKALLQSAAALAVLLAVSFSWMTVVQLTPADSRPFVGGSTNNNVFELMMGHNGIERLLGRGSTGGQSGAPDADRRQDEQNNAPGNGGQQGWGQQDGAGGNFPWGGSDDRQNGWPSNGNDGQDAGGSEQGGFGNGIDIGNAVSTDLNGLTDLAAGTVPHSGGNTDGQNGQPGLPGGFGGQQRGQMQPPGQQGYAQDGDFPAAPGQDDTDQGSFGQGNGDGQGRGKTAGGAVDGSRMDGGVGGDEIGSAGVLRLWNASLAGQVSWLLLPALLGCIVAAGVWIKRARSTWHERRLYRQYGQIVSPALPDVQPAREVRLQLAMWSTALLPMVVFFSIAGFYHRYYLCMMAPAAAALTVAFLSALRIGARYGKRTLACRIAAAATFAATMGISVAIVAQSSWAAIMVPVLLTETAIALVLYIAYCVQKQMLWRRVAVLAMAVALLTAPAVWSATPIFGSPNSTMPAAGPELVAQAQQPDGAGRTGAMDMGSADSGLVDYLLKNYGGETYLVAVSNASTAAPIMLETGKAVMAVGGFEGKDPTLTVDKLAAMVEAGEIRYFMLGNDKGGDTDGEVSQWVQQNGKLIDSTQYSSNAGDTDIIGGRGGSMGTGQLYDLRPIASSTANGE